MRGAVVAALAVLVSAALVAGATVTLRSTSSLTTTARETPIHFETGAGAGNPRYVQNLAVSGNGTTFTGTVVGRIGGEVFVKDVVRVASTSGAARTVTLKGSSVADVTVPSFTWTLRNGTTTVGTMDMKAGSPSLTFTLPAGETDQLDLRIRIVKGAGTNNATFSFSTWLVVT